jgi:outer membrane protein, heavy metal efflux system
MERHAKGLCLCLVALVVCSTASEGFAQSSTLTSSQTLTPPATRLPALVNELLENNPSIRAARYRYEAALKRPSQVSTLPDPKLTYVDFGVGRPFSTFVNDFAYRGVGISQEVPFPGKLSLASEQAQREADSEAQMYRAMVLDLGAELKIAFYEWFSNAKSIEIANKNRDLLDRFEKIARARYSVGKGIQQDVLKAQVEIAKLAQQIEMLEQKRSSAEAQIDSLVNREAGAELGSPPELKSSPFDMDLDAVLSVVQENSPQLRARQFVVDSRAVGMERARRDYRPDFNFSFQWQHTASGSPDYYMATAEVKVPLYFWRKQRFALEEAAARFEESRSDYQADLQRLRFLAKDQFLIVKSSERLLALYESGVIPQSSLSLESALAGYEVGAIDFLTLISNLTTLLTFETEYYQELAKHEQALARLEPIVGRELTLP